MMDDHDVLSRARNELADALKALLKAEIMDEADFKKSLKLTLAAANSLIELLIPDTESPMNSRYAKGPLEERFIVEREDRQPIPSDRRYSLVLDFSGADPHALIAAEAYAASVEAENPDLAAGIRQAIADPATAPKQHRY